MDSEDHKALATQSGSGTNKRIRNSNSTDLFEKRRAEEQNDDPDSFELSDLPRSLVIRFLEKCDFPTFATFNETSSFAEDICSDTYLKIPYLMFFTTVVTQDAMLIQQEHESPSVSFETVTSRIMCSSLAFDESLANNRINEVIELIKKKKPTFKSIDFYTCIASVCSPDDLIELTKICSATRVAFFKFVPNRYLTPFFLKTIERLEIEDGTDFSNDNFLPCSKMPINIQLVGDNASITNEGIGQFLKQWEAPKLFEYLTLRIGRRFGKEELKEVFDGHNPTLIYSKEVHRQSILSETLTIAEVKSSTFGRFVYYALFRNNGTKSFIFVKAGQEELVCKIYRNYDIINAFFDFCTSSDSGDIKDKLEELCSFMDSSMLFPVD